ncbi:NAD(P)H quinone oxidoreductase [Kordiimonas sediminis]|uniref:NAD(P)H quinone oxidoreductase n=1 Tax=Kordiimonas sediminis TaxID=1735581 RepID=A0A919AQU3_9PROT|nr:NAD(P)H-quinone oxidoreductase [Kordiimonas sediminis]GHF20241.1 NAD(P)H quinone oxidoreductase [Kordiimonas sediminis]
MKAVEIEKPGGPEVLKVCDRPVPTPGDGEVLIKVAAAGVNRPDCVQRLGLYPPPPGASDIPGLEVAGVVEALGASVQGIAIGDAVCALVPGGGYAQYVTAPRETVLPVPKGFSMVDAAALPETYFTVWSNVFDRAGLKAGEKFLVHGGSSGIGSTAIQLAKAFGATVFTTAGSADKVAFCKSLGADFAINYREQQFEDVVQAETGGQGVNVILDMVGGAYLNRNISCMALEGRHVSIAFLTGPTAEVTMMPVMLKRLVLTGSTLRPRDNGFKGAIAGNLRDNVWPLLEAGTVRPVIDTVLPLADAAAAHTLMESSRHMGKIILTVD